jgi:16S rRNA G966 N2-methylase RsmD
VTSYFSTFISGLQEVIKSALEDQLSDVEIGLLFDGLIIFQSDQPIQKIKSLRFLNNNFLLLHLFHPKRKNVAGNPIDNMMNAILKKPALIPGVPRWAIKEARSFRIIASIENQTISVENDLLSKIERFFAYRLKLKTNRSRPDIEVWFIERSEGYGFIGIRIKHTQNVEKVLQKGELRTELANMLCYISEPDKEDVFLDPFAGSGSIPIERATAFPYKQVIASEADIKTFERLKKRVSESKLNIILGQWDALNLKSIPNNSIKKIVTDPPWGVFSQPDIDLKVFYLNMLNEFIRILQKDGLITLVMGQKELFEIALNKVPALTLKEKYNILVSGKKAAIYKMGLNYP